MKIRHILADGQEVEQVEGRQIPRNTETEAFFRLLEELTRGQEEEKCENIV